jgi:hypothetical protein
MQWEAKQHAKEKCKDKGILQLGYTFMTHNKQNKSLGGGSLEQGLNQEEKHRKQEHQHQEEEDDHISNNDQTKKKSFIKRSTNIRKRKIKLAFPPMSSCFTITLVRRKL